MQGFLLRLVVVLVFVSSPVFAAESAQTWMLEDGNDWKPVSTDPNSQYALAVTEARKLIDTRQAEAAKEAFDRIKQDFPKLAGPDFDLFAKAEIFYCRGSYSKAMKNYEKLLNKHAESTFYEAALDREFIIAKEFLAGRKKTVLGIFKIRAYADGIKIMERISDRLGLDEPDGLGLRAAITVAEHYEQKQKYNDAYLKWSEIASYWETGQIGKEALLKMAQNKLAAYNKSPEDRRPRYDASRLVSARSYYEKFRLLYPEDAEKINVAQTIKDIDEQLARKELAIGQYYQRTGHKQAANLYFDMVVQNWPDSRAAETARQMLNSSSQNQGQ
jgi:tetratricopeptide (TPR) repeat protein